MKYIHYNHLNLPTLVMFNSGDRIIYTYDALGTKLAKQVIANGVSKFTYYAGAFIYEQDSAGEQLAFFSQPEGYVENNGGAFSYVYQHKDHLGNIRLSYKNTSTTGVALQIVEENNYYPFGLKHKGYNNVVNGSNSAASKFKYNGKELNDELGLDWYHYGARFYDPATARWFTPDAMAEKYYDQSLYNYTVNNPILFIDPDGNQVQMCCEGLMDAVAGFVLGTATNLVPGSTNWRNSYTPNNADTYNNALRVTDIVETTIAIPLIADGLKNITIGGTTTVVGAGASATGVGAVAGVPTIVVGGTITTTGAVEIAAGAMFMINGPNNMAAGYDYGRTDNSSNSSSSEPKGRAGKTITDENGVTVKSHGTNDVHKPAHAHVKGGGKEVRVGANGKPLKGQPSLSDKQQKVVSNAKKQIRNEVNKVGRANKRIEDYNKSK